MERLAAVIGLDLAKNVFQAHGMDSDGRKVFSQRLQRKEVLTFFQSLSPCLVAMEACASSHYWAREIGMLGHETRILPVQEVRPFVTRGKTDAKDAIAICLAARHRDARPVPTKTAEQQAATMLIRTRSLFVRQRSNLINALRAFMAEFGLVAPIGLANAAKMAAALGKAGDARLPSSARRLLAEILGEVEALNVKIRRLERELAAEARRDDVIARLRTIPGIGILTAALMRAAVIDPHGFKSARHFSSWLGLTPRVSASGSTMRLGRISKQGNKDLRSMLFLGAIAAIRSLRRKGNIPPWLRRILENRPYKVAVIALANRMARIAWAVMVKGEVYRNAQATR